MATSNFDKSIERMKMLMTYDNRISPLKESCSNVEFYKMGADGKVYGIVREGAYHVIKTTEPGKERIYESYQYIGGERERKGNSFTDYNRATKHLETRLMNLNESYGKKLDTSTVDEKKSEKFFAQLTEAARAELNRMNQIFENSNAIGKNNVGVPEAKGHAAADETEKNNKPFDEKAEAKLDKDPGFKGELNTATDNKEVKNVEQKLESDKAPSCEGCCSGEGEAAHADIEGKSVAEQKPRGGKPVMKINEETDELEIGDEELDGLGDGEIEVADTEDPEGGDVEADDTAVEEPAAVGDDIVGIDDDPAEETDLDQLITEFEDAMASDGADSEIDAAPEEPAEPIAESEIKPRRIDESLVNTITEDVFSKLKKGRVVKESAEDMIYRIISEEVNNLDVWGQHPGYRKKPFTTPSNTEPADKSVTNSWDDDSVKGEQPFGQKIGDGAPFNEKVVKMMTDSIMASLMNGIAEKKK